MAPKLISAIATFLVNIAASLLVLFMMLVAMNGFSESDGEKGLAVYLVLAFAITLLVSLGAFLLAGSLLGKQYSAIASTLIAILVFSIGGVVLNIISGLIGIGVAQYVRLNY